MIEQIHNSETLDDDVEVDKLNFVVGIEFVGKRIDSYLAEMLEDISRSYIQKLISVGDVLANDVSIRANYKLRFGDIINVNIPEPQGAEIQPEDIPLNVLYEDKDMIIINKKRGMVVHPAPGNYQGTLVNALLFHCKDLSGINGVLRPGIVHRLDKDTSGVMVAAKNDIAHMNLAEQIKAHTAKRTYLAIVYGNIVEDKGIINAPIGRHQTERKKMAVIFSNSKEAVTHFFVIARFGSYSLIQCQLETGRTHQIRVHMAYIGHPVLGDGKYGPKSCKFNIVGQALHSSTLKLVHPISNQDMEFFAPLPEDMENILTQLRRQ